MTPTTTSRPPRPARPTRPARPPRPHPAIARRRRAVRGLPSRGEAIALGAVGLACAIVGYWLATGPVLSVHGTRVSGYDRPDATALQAAVADAADRGGSLLSPPVGAIRRRAITFPWVKDVYVARDWPVGIVVQIIPAEPIAIGVPTRGPRVLISSRGLVMGPAKGVRGLPRLVIPGAAPEEGQQIPAGARAALSLVKFSTPATAARFRKLRIEGGQLVGLLANGPELRLGAPTRIRAKAIAIEAVLLYANPEEKRTATYIDVSVPDHPALGGVVPIPDPVVVPEPAPAPAPTAPADGAATDPAATDPAASGAGAGDGTDPAADATGDAATDPADGTSPDAAETDLIDPAAATGAAVSPSSGG